jgi:hypothetical protein
MTVVCSVQCSALSVELCPVSGDSLCSDAANVMQKVAYLLCQMMRDYIF